MFINLRNYNPIKDVLKGKKILITGAGTDIGKEAAIKFAKHGARTILLGKTEKNLKEVYDIIVQKSYPEPSLQLMDFEHATPKDYLSLFEAIKDKYGLLDGLLNSVTILGEKKPLSQYSYAIWRKVLTINLDSAFYLTQSLLPLLELSDSASIIFSSSDEGKKGRAFWGAHSVSKFGIEGLMQILADELENTSNIQVNSINPGKIKSELRLKSFPAEDPRSLILPKDIMSLYLYLISNEDRNLNGKSINAQIL